MSRYLQRFTRWQRFQHFCVMTIFTLLCATGLPQKYFDAGWAQWMLGIFGGVDRARWRHRACGLSVDGRVVTHCAVASSASIR
ncbi:MAG: cytochrome C, partial [Acidobacteriota bacterium]